MIYKKKLKEIAEEIAFLPSLRMPSMGRCVGIEKDAKRPNIRVVKGRPTFIDEHSGALVGYRIKVEIEISPDEVPNI